MTKRGGGNPVREKSAKFDWIAANQVTSETFLFVSALTEAELARPVQARAIWLIEARQ